MVPARSHHIRRAICWNDHTLAEFNAKGVRRLGGQKKIKELIDKYQPDYLCFDGEWEHGEDVWRSHEALAWLFNDSPVAEDVVVNDRWAKAYINAGRQILTPSDALAFTRVRKTISGGDFTRKFHGGLALIAAATMVQSMGPEAIPRLLEALEGLEGIKQYTTQSSENVGTTIIEVKENYDINDVLDRVRSNVDAISTFPVDAEEPVITEITVKDPVMLLYLSGDMSERRIKEWAERIKDEIQQLPNISQVEAFGARNYEIAIEVSEEHRTNANKRAGVTTVKSAASGSPPRAATFRDRPGRIWRSGTSTWKRRSSPFP